MLPLPSTNPTSALKLADWLELTAVLSPDGNSSSGDLDSALRVASHRGLTEDEAIERKVLEVFAELESRERASGPAYPFVFSSPQLLQAKPNWLDRGDYLFCLCLSYRGASQAGDATRLFEELACRAAGNYLQGNVVRFGWPRRELPQRFSLAIDELCNRIGEGEGFRAVEPHVNAKDEGLDIVAWKDFADKGGSKLFLFGQCAAGLDWQEKLTELQPSGFLGSWFRGALISPEPLRSFFVPHRIARRDWARMARTAGILFDRCRIAYWAEGVVGDFSDQEQWTADYLQQVAGS